MATLLFFVGLGFLLWGINKFVKKITADMPEDYGKDMSGEPGSRMIDLSQQGHGR